MKRYTVHIVLEGNQKRVKLNGEDRFDSFTAANIAQDEVEYNRRNNVRGTVFIKDEVSKNIICMWETKDGYIEQSIY